MLLEITHACKLSMIWNETRHVFCSGWTASKLFKIAKLKRKRRFIFIHWYSAIFFFLKSMYILSNNLHSQCGVRPFHSQCGVRPIHSQCGVRPFHSAGYDHFQWGLSLLFYDVHDSKWTFKKWIDFIAEFIILTFGIFPVAQVLNNTCIWNNIILKISLVSKHVVKFHI